MVAWAIHPLRFLNRISKDTRTALGNGLSRTKGSTEKQETRRSERPCGMMPLWSTKLTWTTASPRC